MIEGLEDCEEVAFSTKGLMRHKDVLKIATEAIQFTVDHLKKLKAIIIYSVCGNDNKIYDLFKYASDHGIDLIVPNNTLKSRNVTRLEERHGKISE